MAAFTEEQMKILEGMFDHMWARMEALHDDLNEDSTRIGALGVLLMKQQLLTPAQWETTMKTFDMEAKESRGIRNGSELTEQDTTRNILRGGTWE